MDPLSKEKLRKKLNKKKEERKKGKSVSESPDLSEDSLFNMLNDVNKLLKENPNMIKKVSKCVNSIFENKNLMESLVNEIKTNITESREPVQVSQTLVNKDPLDSLDADSNESKQ
jgi:hypothetical protein